MKESYEKIVKSLEKELEILETENGDILKKAELAIKILKLNLQKIKELVVSSNFKLIDDEIKFFKSIKPKVYAKLIYYVKLFNIESKRPKGSSKFQKKYLDLEIKKLQDYFNDNLEFYQYFRRDGTSLDHQYFVRGSEDLRLHPDHFHFFTDEKFSTSHDSTVATIMAYDMLIVYLQQEIEKIENRNSMETNINAFQNHSKLCWTGSKTDLIELIYALHSSGYINSGIVDIKEMAVAFEQTFNIDLGNYYHTFAEIKSRKSNSTKFLDNLKESLLIRIEESEA